MSTQCDNFKLYKFGRERGWGAQMNENLERLSRLFVEDSGKLLFVRNAIYDSSTGVWTQPDTSKASTAIVHDTNGDIEFKTCPAGNSTITWSSGGIVGNLKDTTIQTLTAIAQRNSLDIAALKMGESIAGTMTDAIIDDLSDTSGIDTASSTNITHDSALGMVKQVNPAAGESGHSIAMTMTASAIDTYSTPSVCSVILNLVNFLDEISMWDRQTWSFMEDWNEHVNYINPSKDISVYVSRDNGVTWMQAAMASTTAKQSSGEGCIALSEITVKATSQDFATTYYPEKAFAGVSAAWRSATNVYTNQCLHFDIKYPERLSSIRVCGANGSWGQYPNDIELYGTNDATVFSHVDWNDDTGWAKIKMYSDADRTIETFGVPISVTADDNSLYYYDLNFSHLNPKYRYYRFKFASNHANASYMTFAVSHVKIFGRSAQALGNVSNTAMPYLSARATSEYNASAVAENAVVYRNTTPWYSASGAVTNQRLNISNNWLYPFKCFHIASYSSYNAQYGYQPKNFELYGSNNPNDYYDTSYDSTGDWVRIPAYLDEERSTEVTQLPNTYATNTPNYILYMPADVPTYRYYSFKFADTWRNSGYMAFKLYDQYNTVPVYTPPATIIRGKATTSTTGASTQPVNILKEDGNVWRSLSGDYTNQRVNLDMGKVCRVKSFRFPAAGSTYFKNFILYGSNSKASFDETGFSEDSGWTQIATYSDENCLTPITQGLQTLGDGNPPYYIYLSANTPRYRYYSFKISDNWSGASYIQVYCNRIEIYDSDDDLENGQTAEVEYSANLSAMPSGDNLVVKVSVPYGNSLAIDKISTIWR